MPVEERPDAVLGEGAVTRYPGSEGWLCQAWTALGWALQCARGFPAHVYSGTWRLRALYMLQAASSDPIAPAIP